MGRGETSPECPTVSLDEWMAIGADNCRASSMLDSSEIENPIVTLEFDSFYSRQRSDKPKSTSVAALNSGFEEEETVLPHPSTDHMQADGLVAWRVSYARIR